MHTEAKLKDLLHFSLTIKMLFLSKVGGSFEVSKKHVNNIFEYEKYVETR